MTSMRRPVLIFLLAAAALSCSRPSSQEPFVTREKAEYGDTYNFTLPMDDSTRSYSLAFYTRLERKPLVPFSTDSVILEVRFVSPSDSVVQDKVVMRFGHPTDSSSRVTLSSVTRTGSRSVNTGTGASRCASPEIRKNSGEWE